MSPAVSHLGSTLFSLLLLNSSPPRETSMILAMRTGDTRLEQAPVSPVSPVSMGRFDRYLGVDRLALSGRFRATRISELQYQAALKGSFKLDRAENFVVRAGAFTGSGFSGGWDDRLYLKQLYLDASVLPRTSIRFGGLDIAHGESTEVTSYDFDGYVTGTRVEGTGTHAAFDSLALTLAHLGDFDSPSVLDRFSSISDPNYAQILWTKRFFRRLSASAEYSSAEGEPTWRQAARLTMPEGVPLDVVQFENYQRRGVDPGYGWGVYGQLRLRRPAALGMGFASIDRGGLNSDRFPRGKRLYATALLPLGRELTLSVFVSQAVGDASEGAPRRRLDLALSYDLLERFSGS